MVLCHSAPLHSSFSLPIRFAVVALACTWFSVVISGKYSFLGFYRLWCVFFSSDVCMYFDYLVCVRVCVCWAYGARTCYASLAMAFTLNVLFAIDRTPFSTGARELKGLTITTTTRSCCRRDCSQQRQSMHKCFKVMLTCWRMHKLWYPNCTRVMELCTHRHTHTHSLIPLNGSAHEKRIRCTVSFQWPMQWPQNTAAAVVMYVDGLMNRPCCNRAQKIYDSCA